MNRRYMPGQGCCPCDICSISCGWLGCTNVGLDVTISGVTSGTGTSCTNCENFNRIWFNRNAPGFSNPCDFWSEGNPAFDSSGVECDVDFWFIDTRVGVRNIGGGDTYSLWVDIGAVLVDSTNLSGPTFGHFTSASGEVFDLLRRLCQGENLELPAIDLGSSLINERCYFGDSTASIKYTGAKVC